SNVCQLTNPIMVQLQTGEVSCVAGTYYFVRAHAGSVPPSDVTIIFQDTILRRRRCDAEVAPTAVIKTPVASLSQSAQGVRGARLARSVLLVQQAWLRENCKF